MNTAPIKPAATSNQPAARQAPSSSSDASSPFGAMLSQEIAQRDTAATSEAGKLKSAGRAESGKSATSSIEAKPAGDATSTKDAEAAGKEDAAATDAAAQTPPELLAMMSDIRQLSTPATAVVDAAASGTSATAEMLETDLAVDTGAADTRSRKETATAADLTEPVNAGKELSGKELAAATRDNLAATPATQGTAASKQDFAALLNKDSANAIGNVNTSAATMAPVQQTATAWQNAVSPQASDKLMPPVGTPAWDQALGNKVVWMVGNGLQSASLTLNPPDLGPLQVVLSVSNNQATATFVSAQPEVRQALETAMPKLREMMQESGVQLGQTAVGTGSRDQQDAQNRQSTGSRRGFGASEEAGAIAGITTTTQPLSQSGRGLVDTFV